MNARKQEKNILRVALSLSVILHLAGYYFLFPLEWSAHENKQTFKVKVLVEQAKKLPAKEKTSPKKLPSTKKVKPPTPAQQKNFSPVSPKDRTQLPDQISTSSTIRAPRQIASFADRPPLQKIIRQERNFKANTQFSAKSPTNIEVRPQSAKRLQMASIHPQAVSRQIQASIPKTVQSHEASKMSLANSRPGPVKENVHAQLKSPPSTSVGDFLGTAQPVHQTTQAVMAIKEIRQRSLEEISLASYHPTVLMSSKSTAPVATNSLRHPARQFPSPSRANESAVSPQQISGDMSLKLTRLFPAELRSQQNVLPGNPAEEINPVAPSSAIPNPAQETHFNSLPGTLLEPSKSPGLGKNHSDLHEAGSGEAHRVFSAKIWGKIARQKYYPRIARKRGYQGKPVVSFTIDESGDLLDLMLLQASSHKILDEAALTAVRKASPYPPIPEELKLRSMKFKLPITFILDGP